MLRLAHSYSCLMARLPKLVADKVVALADAIPDEYIYDDEDGELGREDSPHVTIKYGIHTSDSQEVEEKLRGQDPVVFRLGQTSVFNAPDYVVLKLGVTGESIHMLNRLVCREFECTDTHPEYNPHVTIAYLKKGPPEDPYYFKEFFTDELEGTIVSVEQLEFSPAEGEKAMVPLGGNNYIAREILDVARSLLRNREAHKFSKTLHQEVDVASRRLGKISHKE